MLTDGQSQDKSRTISAAKSARYSGIKMFAIGIGNSIDQNELRAIGSNGRKRKVGSSVFHLNSFSSLQSGSFRNMISDRACNGKHINK